ncbi:hypothetical protein, partial [Ruegeria lacuscaerulensis]
MDEPLETKESNASDVSDFSVQREVDYKAVGTHLITILFPRQSFGMPKWNEKHRNLDSLVMIALIN